MSFGIRSDGPVYTSASVGNGGQRVVMGLLLAAYAVDRRPESNRVCAWVDSSPNHTIAVHPRAPRSERNRPASVEALISFTYDGAGDPGGEPSHTAVCPVDETIRLGIKMKAVTDQALADLVTMYLAMCDPWDYSGTLSADLVRRMAKTLEELLPNLKPAGYWYDTMAKVALAFRAAAAAGATVSYG